MATLPVGAIAPFVETVVSYFSPSKSPFYAIIVAGTFSLVWCCDHIEGDSWNQIAIPIYAVIVIALVFSLKSKSKPEEQEDQLKFARSICISFALVSLALISASIAGDGKEKQFYASYSAAMIQIMVFLVYSWARIESAERKDFNFVQLSLVTATFFVGASYSILQNAALGGETPEKTRFLYSAIGLYLLWFFCILFWIDHLRKIIVVKVRTEV